jgi:hypothetical protein
MPDQTNGNQPSGGKQGNLGDEFVNLGKNLAGFFRAAWESPDGQALKEEVEAGLNELGNSINKAANEINENEPGRQLKKDFEDLTQRMASGELENRGREEMLSALRKVNEEITRAAANWKKSDPSGPKE